MSDKTQGGVTIAASQLLSIIERIEHLEADKVEVVAEIKEIYDEAKGNGFDVKTLRKIVALRKKPVEERTEEEAMLDLYLCALGMIPSPDGQDSPATHDFRPDRDGVDDVPPVPEVPLVAPRPQADEGLPIPTRSWSGLADVIPGASTITEVGDDNVGTPRHQRSAPTAGPHGGSDDIA